MRLHHSFHTIPVDGAEALRSFYSGLLGLQEIPRAKELGDAPLIWFAVGDDHLHFCLDASWERGHPDHHIALFYEDLEPVIERLQAAGYAVGDRVGFSEYGYKRFYVQDPFDRQVEMITPLRKPEPTKAS